MNRSPLHLNQLKVTSSYIYALLHSLLSYLAYHWYYYNQQGSKHRNNLSTNAFTCISVYVTERLKLPFAFIFSFFFCPMRFYSSAMPTTAWIRMSSKIPFRKKKSFFTHWTDFLNQFLFYMTFSNVVRF